MQGRSQPAMTITNLLLLLAPQLRTWYPHRDMPAGTPVGFDTSVIVHAKMSAHAEAITMQIGPHRWQDFRQSVVATLRRMQQWGEPRAGGIVLHGALDGLRAVGKRVQEKRVATAEAAFEAVEAARSGDGPTVDAATKQKAAGAMKIEAGHQALCAARDAGFLVECAPVEAEQQLVRWQREGRTEYIAVNDSDYIAIGGTNLLFSQTLWADEVRLCRTENLRETPATSARATRTFKTDQPLMLRWFKVLEEHGERAVLMCCLVVKNDFANIPGVGVMTAMRAVCRAHESCSTLPGPNRLELADAVHQKLRHTDAGDVDAETNSMVRSIEVGLLMLRHQCVSTTVDGKRVLEPLYPVDLATFRTLDVLEAEQLRGGDVLRGKDVGFLTNGNFDVDSLVTGVAPTARNPLPPANGGHYTHTPDAQLGEEDQQAFRQPGASPPEAPDDVLRQCFSAWANSDLQQWCRARGVATGVPGLLARVAVQYKAKKPLRTSVATIHRQRAMVEANAWRVVQANPGDWTPLTKDNEKRLLPTIPRQLCEHWLATSGAGTLRNEQNSARRFSRNRAVHREPAYESEGGHGKCQRVHHTLEVGRSITDTMRLVLVTALANLTANDTVTSIVSVRCLHPPGSFDSATGEHAGGSHESGYRARCKGHAYLRAVPAEQQQQLCALHGWRAICVRTQLERQHRRGKGVGRQEGRGAECRPAPVRTCGSCRLRLYDIAPVRTEPLSCGALRRDSKGAHVGQARRQSPAGVHAAAARLA